MIVDEEAKLEMHLDALYPLQKLRRFEADVQPIGRLAAQLDSLELTEPRGGFHLAKNRARVRLAPDGQGDPEMPITSHRAPCFGPENSRHFFTDYWLNFLV